MRLACVRCGADLRKLSINAACPTCALPVRASINPEGVGDTGERVCGACGYSLRGLVAERCPECGASTAGAQAAATTLQRALGWLSSDPTPCARCGEPILAVDEGKCRACGLGMPPLAPPLNAEEIAAGRAAGAMPKQCERCGYDLQGCRSKRCPECGAMISRRRRLAAAPLSTMPLLFVRRIRTRLVAAAACAAVPIFASLGLSIAVVAGTGSGARLSPACCMAVMSIAAAPLVPFSTVTAIAAAGYAVGLALAVFLATTVFDEPSAVENGFGARDRLRRLARWSSLAWLATPLCAVPAAITGAGLWFNLLCVAIALGLLSLSPASFHLRRIADWVRDDRAERWFGIAGLCALAAPLLPVLVIGVGANVAAVLIFMLVPLACCTAFYGFAAAIAWLAISAHHCVRHAADDLRRIERKAERFAERARESAAMVRKLDAGAPWRP